MKLHVYPRPTTIHRFNPISTFWHEAKDGYGDTFLIFEGIFSDGIKETLFWIYIIGGVLDGEKYYVIKDLFVTKPIAVTLSFNFIEGWINEIYGHYPSKSPDGESIIKSKLPF